MKNLSKIMIGYGAFLIVAGLLGYLSNPDKAKTALMSGGLFGSISIGLGLAATRGWRPSLPISLGLTSFLGVVFTWRAAVSWMAFFGGEPGKLTAAALISAMLLASVTVVALLLKRRSRHDDPHFPESAAGSSA